MTQRISIAYLSDLSSAAFNEKIYQILGANIVKSGFNITAGSAKTLNILKDSGAPLQALFIKGVYVEEALDMLSAITVPDNNTGSDRTDVVYAEYIHGMDAVCEYKIATGTTTVPSEDCCLLATLTVPNGFTASSELTVTPVEKMMSMDLLKKKVVESTVEPTEGLFPGLMWYNPDNGVTKAWLAGEFREVGGGAVLTVYPNVVNIAAPTNTVTIGIPGYNKEKDYLQVIWNTTLLTENVHYTINEDGLGITKITDDNGANWGPCTFVFNVFGTAQTKPDILGSVYLENDYTILTNETHIPIGIPMYNPVTDILDVFYNNAPCFPGENRQYLNPKDGIYIDLQFTPDAGDEIHLRVIKKVRINSDYSDGSLIADGSISVNKFTPGFVAEILSKVSVEDMNQAIADAIDSAITPIQQQIDDLEDEVGEVQDNTVALVNQQLSTKDTTSADDILSNVIALSNSTLKYVSIDKLAGRTVVNLLGSDGDCEDTSKWTASQCTHALDSTTKVLGSNSIKITISAANGILGRDILSTIDKTKYYCLSAYLKNGNATNVGIGFYGTGISLFSAAVTDTAKFNRICVKVNPAALAAATTISAITTVNGANTQYAFVDGIMLNEISATEYADANYVPPEYTSFDNWTSDTILKITGKNIFNVYDGNIKAGKFLDQNGNEMTDANSQYFDGYIRIIPGQAYYFSKPARVMEYGSAKEWLRMRGSGTKQDFIFSSDAHYIRVSIWNDTANSTDANYFKTLQIEPGAAATTYEPYTETKIPAKYPLYECLGVKNTTEGNKQIKRVERSILDGTLVWSHYNNIATFKCIRTPLTGAKSYDTNCLYKFNGKQIPCVGSWSGDATVEQAQVDTVSGYILIRVMNTDSGWGDTVTPTASEMAAYMNGWKMNNGTFGTAYNGTGTKTWTAWNATSNTGSVTTCPTTKAAGWVPYKMYYQLALPVVTEIVPMLAQVPVGGNIVVDATIKPYLSYTLHNNLYAALTAIGDVAGKLTGKMANAVAKDGDEMTGILKAKNNTSYTVGQVRNIFLSTLDADPNIGDNGDIWIKYKTS